MYIAKVASLGRDDAAKQLKKIVGNELGLSIIQIMYCIITYLPFVICDWLLLREMRNDKYIMMQYTIMINSIPWSGDYCQFEFGRVIIERWLSNFLLQKQPKLFAWCLWAYCDKNLLSIYPECNISLPGVKWFKFLSHIHSTLFLCGFCNRKSDELPFCIWGCPVQSKHIISKIEGMQYN